MKKIKGIYVGWELLNTVLQINQKSYKAMNFSLIGYLTGLRTKPA